MPGPNLSGTTRKTNENTDQNLTLSLLLEQALATGNVRDARTALTVYQKQGKDPAEEYNRTLELVKRMYPEQDGFLLLSEVLPQTPPATAKGLSKQPQAKSSTPPFGNSSASTTRPPMPPPAGIR